MPGSRSAPVATRSSSGWKRADGGNSQMVGGGSTGTASTLVSRNVGSSAWPEPAPPSSSASSAARAADGARARPDRGVRPRGAAPRHPRHRSAPAGRRRGRQAARGAEGRRRPGDPRGHREPRAVRRRPGLPDQPRRPGHDGLHRADQHLRAGAGRVPDDRRHRPPAGLRPRRPACAATPCWSACSARSRCAELVEAKKIPAPPMALATAPAHDPDARPGDLGRGRLRPRRTRWPASSWQAPRAVASRWWAVWSGWVPTAT